MTDGWNLPMIKKEKEKITDTFPSLMKERKRKGK